jgi:urate oxidase
VSNKLDDLFSPQRLRRHWQQGKKEAAHSETKEEPNAPMLLERLKALITERFKEDEAASLTYLLEDLGGNLLRRFPGAGEDEATSEGKNQFDPAIHEAIDRIEDLVEAYELAGRGR